MPRRANLHAAFRAAPYRSPVDGPCRAFEQPRTRRKIRTSARGPSGLLTVACTATSLGVGLRRARALPLGAQKIRLILITTLGRLHFLTHLLFAFGGFAERLVLCKSRAHGKRQTELSDRDQCLFHGGSLLKSAGISSMPMPSFPQRQDFGQPIETLQKRCQSTSF